MCRRLVHALCPHSCSTHLAVRICITGAHSLLCFQAKQLDDADEEVLQGIFAEATAVAPAPTAPPTADEQPPNKKGKRGLDDADGEVLQGIFAEATAVAPVPTAPPTADEQPPNKKAKREPQ